MWPVTIILDFLSRSGLPPKQGVHDALFTNVFKAVIAASLASSLPKKVDLAKRFWKGVNTLFPPVESSVKDTKAIKEMIDQAEEAQIRRSAAARGLSPREENKQSPRTSPSLGIALTRPVRQRRAPERFVPGDGYDFRRFNLFRNRLYDTGTMH